MTRPTDQHASRAPGDLVAPRKPISHRSLALIGINILALIVCTFGLMPRIDAQIQDSEVQIASGYEGLARVTALAIVMVGSVATYLFIRLSAYLLENVIIRRLDRNSFFVSAVDISNVIAVVLVLGLVTLGAEGMLASVTVGLTVPITLLLMYFFAPPKRHMSLLSAVCIAVASAAVIASHMGRL